jgi:acetylornithine deacetylase
MAGPTYTPIELLARLVAFDTTSHKSNLGIVAFIEDYLLQHGVTSRRIVTADGQKAALFATVGPDDRAGVALSGHTDVVPVGGQTWTSDPFTLRQEGGKLYGRGACDMKGYLACMLAAVPDFTARTLKTPIHMVFSYDEEVGCLGVRPVIAEFAKTLPTPRAVFVGEPTNMRVVDAHKGPVRWQVEVTGRAAHSSMAHLGVNAITYGTRLISELERIEAELKITSRNDHFVPPYASLQVTMLEGGTANNIIPIYCRFGFEVRSLPGVDVDGIEQRLRTYAQTRLIPEMQEIAPEAGIAITRVNTVPPFLAQQGSLALTLALQLTDQNETHTVSYATEAGLFQDGGAPSIVCGPGDIAQAHTADEWLDESELDKCMGFMRRLADWAEA